MGIGVLPLLLELRAGCSLEFASGDSSRNANEMASIGFVALFFDFIWSADFFSLVSGRGGANIGLGMWCVIFVAVSRPPKSAGYDFLLAVIIYLYLVMLSRPPS
jgi:hypothetical protein